MTRPTLVFLLCLLAAANLLAQAKNMGPATQYYKQTPTKKNKFKVFTPPKKGGEVQIEAQKQTGQAEEYTILEGNVKITYEDIHFVADKMTYNLKTKDVVAEGHVILDQATTRLAGDQAYFNLDSKTGTFIHASGSIEPAMYFTGEKMEKLDDENYRLTNGVLTSCDLDSPSWSLHVIRADVTVDDYARMHEASFRIHRFPIFWTPYLIWPTKGDRSQGLLIPRITFSSCNPAS